MDETWTLPDLVTRVAEHLAALPPPKNGQVRAVPDDRTVRYYGTIGLLDRPVATRGRTALYGRRHLAQVVAIKRLQSLGRSLSEIQALWPTLDDATLARISGVALAGRARGSRASRSDFWKREIAPAPATPTAALPAAARSMPASASPIAPPVAPPVAPIELRVELAPGAVLVLAMPETGVALTSADVRALRAAAAPLVAELAHRRLTPHAGEEEP